MVVENGVLSERRTDKTEDESASYDATISCNLASARAHKAPCASEEANVQ